MIYLHPIFMTVLLCSLYYLHSFGKKALSINPKSPEADQKNILISQHQKMGIAVTVLMALGLIFGIFVVFKIMGINEVFLKTYGHGFAGAILLGLMIANIFVGRSIRMLVREKARAGLLRFHFGLFYLTLVTSLYSLISGLRILISGPMP